MNNKEIIKNKIMPSIEELSKKKDLFLSDIFVKLIGLTDLANVLTLEAPTGEDEIEVIDDVENFKKEFIYVIDVAKDYIENPYNHTTRNAFRDACYYLGQSLGYLLYDIGVLIND